MWGITKGPRKNKVENNIKVIKVLGKIKYITCPIGLCHSSITDYICKIWDQYCWIRFGSLT